MFVKNRYRTHTMHKTKITESFTQSVRRCYVNNFAVGRSYLQCWKNSSKIYENQPGLRNATLNFGFRYRAVGNIYNVNSKQHFYRKKSCWAKTWIWTQDSHVRVWNSNHRTSRLHILRRGTFTGLIAFYYTIPSLIIGCNDINASNKGHTQEVSWLSG